MQGEGSDMRRFMLLASLALVLPTPAHAATEIASCAVSTPRLAPPPGIPIPPAIPPNVPMWAPYDPVESCTPQEFTTTAAQSVTTLLDPDDGFFGIAGLRVRGPSALYSQIEATFANGTMVSGEETLTFTLPAGTWTLDVFLGGTLLPPGAGFRSTGSFSVGTYRGSISA